MTIDRHHYGCRCHRADGFTMAGAENHYAPDLELEPVHLDIQLTFDIEHRSVDGVVTHTIHARRETSAALALHAVGFASVDVATRDGKSLAWRYDGESIRITWDDAWDADETREVAITYHVVEPVAGMYFSAPSKAYPDAAFYVATDNETEKARHWLPTIDLPSVRPTLDFHLTAKSALTRLANGLLVGEEDNGDGTTTTHWKLGQPCPSYLTCVAVGDFVRCDDGEHNGIPVAYFTAPPLTAEDLKRSFGRTRDMLSWMAERLDTPFPYPKYYQFALPAFGGAMENISLVSWDDMFVMDETLATEWTRLVDQINLHEMAHSYFGDLVTCRDFAHAWLKESWATYMEQVWFEEGYEGDDEGRYEFFMNARAYFQEADGNYKRPIVTRKFNHSWDMYDRHLYPGGACRLHTLRYELGDDVFWEGVALYLDRFGGKVVETADFRRTLEEVSGRSLAKWFDQWIHGKGYPHLKASFSYDSKREEGTFSIEQTQVDDKAGVGAFDLAIDVGWVIDGELHTKSVKLDKAKQTVIVSMSADPAQVRLDPHGRVLHKLEFNPGDDKLKTQLTTADDVVGRILAAHELADTGKSANIAAIVDAYAEEAFWGVRAEIGRALADNGSQAALDALADLIGTERDAQVLEPLIRVAGRFRDAGLASAISDRIDSGDLAYRASQAAYEALGRQRDDAPFDRIAAAAKEEGFGGIVQAGALRGLAGTRSSDAIGRLRELAAYGSIPMRARPTAAAALGSIGRIVDKRDRETVVDSLVALLRDPNDRVRAAAARALGTMRATEAIGAIERYASGLAAQEATGIRRMVSRMRSGETPRTKNVDKQLDELREKVRKLESALDKLDARVGDDD